MKSLKVEPALEAQLRREILEYFLLPGFTAVMRHTEPFAANIAEGLYTADQLTFVRRSLWSAGLLEKVRGTTVDNVLIITELGRYALSYFLGEPTCAGSMETRNAHRTGVPGTRKGEP